MAEGVTEETDEAFLARLQEVAENWRYSNEFIGIMVRCRWPEKHADG